MEEAEEDMVQAYLEKSKLEKEEVEIIRQRALKVQEEFEALEQKQNENKEIHDKMKEEIKKMDQAVADSSTFIKRMKNKDPQQIALEKAISDLGHVGCPAGTLSCKDSFIPIIRKLK